MFPEVVSRSATKNDEVSETNELYLQATQAMSKAHEVEVSG